MDRLTTVPAGQSPRRLDVFVSAQTAHVSRTVAQRWIDRGLVTVNGRPAKRARQIHPGDVIAFCVATREPPPVEPEPIPLVVLHEDRDLLIVDKPAGLVMHPAPGHWTGTLLNALVHHVAHGTDAGPGAVGDPLRVRPGLVHRLDRGTSGVVVIAKTDAAHRELSRQFHAHSIHRVYVALVAGRVRRGGTIDQPIGRDSRDPRLVSARSRSARPAVTELRVVERLGRDATLLELRPRTGRMHQLRAHLTSIGHPVLGDAAYGGEDPAIGRPMLHAAELGFLHPGTAQYVEYRVPLPPDMAGAIAERRRRLAPAPRS